MKKYPKWPAAAKIVAVVFSQSVLSTGLTTPTGRTASCMLSSLSEIFEPIARVPGAAQHEASLRRVAVRCRPGIAKERILFLLWRSRISSAPRAHLEISPCGAGALQCIRDTSQASTNLGTRGPAAPFLYDTFRWCIHFFCLTENPARPAR